MQKWPLSIYYVWAGIQDSRAVIPPAAGDGSDGKHERGEYTVTIKEKSRSLCDQGAGHGENAACDRAAFSTTDSSTTAASSQQGGQISKLLLKGEENAIPGPELARMAAVSPRKLRIMVDLERLKRPICASDRGYFLPDDGSKGIFELRRFVLRQDSRCAANRRVTKTARAALLALEREPLDGQETFFSEGNN